MGPDADLLRTAIGTEAVSLEPVGGGYTRSQAWKVSTPGGTVFAKQADDEGSLHMLRREAVVYESVRAPFLPGFVGFADRGDRALLAVENVEGAY